MSNIKKFNRPDIYRKMCEESKIKGEDGEITDYLHNWLTTNDLIVQYEGNELGEEITTLFGSTKDVKTVLYDTYFPVGGGGGLPLSEFGCGAGWLILFVVGEMTKGFFGKIGGDVAKWAKKVFKLWKQNKEKRIAPIGFLFPRFYYYGISYILHNYLEEEDFVAAVSSISDHVKNYANTDPSKIRPATFIYDVKRKQWILDSMDNVE